MNWFLAQVLSGLVFIPGSLLLVSKYHWTLFPIYMWKGLVVPYLSALHHSCDEGESCPGDFDWDGLLTMDAFAAAVAIGTIWVPLLTTFTMQMVWFTTVLIVNLIVFVHAGYLWGFTMANTALAYLLFLFGLLKRVDIPDRRVFIPFFVVSSMAAAFFILARNMEYNSFHLTFHLLAGAASFLYDWALTRPDIRETVYIPIE